jgi:O-antigen/teichoic acid export membrane protein
MKTALSPTKSNRNAIPGPALACLALLLLLASPAVFAYLDPSTGSMVVSAIVGIFASIALAVKTYWYKIKGWFRRGSKQEPGSRETPE